MSIESSDYFARVRRRDEMLHEDLRRYEEIERFVEACWAEAEAEGPWVEEEQAPGDAAREGQQR